MRIRKAKLARREVNGVDLVQNHVVLGKEYHIDLDSERKYWVRDERDSSQRPPFTTMFVLGCDDVDEGYMPLELLDVDPEPCEFDAEIERRLCG